MRDPRNPSSTSPIAPPCSALGGRPWRRGQGGRRQRAI